MPRARVSVALEAKPSFDCRVTQNPDNLTKERTLLEQGFLIIYQFPGCVTGRSEWTGDANAVVFASRFPSQQRLYFLPEPQGQAPLRDCAGGAWSGMVWPGLGASLRIAAVI